MAPKLVYFVLGKELLNQSELILRISNQVCAQNPALVKCDEYLAIWLDTSWANEMNFIMKPAPGAGLLLNLAYTQLSVLPL